MTKKELKILDLIIEFLDSEIGLNKVFIKKLK